MNRLIVEFDGEDVNVDVPTSWDEVNVVQAARLNDIKIEEGKTEYDYFIELISILVEGINDEIIEGFSEDEYLLVSEWISNFTSEPAPLEKKESINIDGEEYFIKSDFDNFTTGEIASIKIIEKRFKNIPNYAMPAMLCIMLRKKLPNGKLETFKSSFMEREEIFKKAIITDVNHLFKSFIAGRALSKKNTSDSSISKKKPRVQIDIR